MAKYNDMVRVILNVPENRIVAATVATKAGPLRIGRVKTPALVVRAILDRAPESVKWWRSWPPFARLSRDEVRQMLEQAETPDVYALLPPGQTYSRADEMFSRDGPQEPLPGRRGRSGPRMGWPLNIKSPVLSTPADRYVNSMLLQMFESSAMPRVLKRSAPLLDLTFRNETVTAPPLHDVLARLKEKCRIVPQPPAGPVEGTFDLTVQGTQCKLWCRFDDDADICCEIRLEDTGRVAEQTPKREKLDDRQRGQTC